MTYLDQATKSGKYFVRDDPLSLPKAILYGVTNAIPGTESAVEKRMSRFRADKNKWNEKAEKLLVLMGMDQKVLYTENDLKKLSTHFTEHCFTLFTREKGEKKYKQCFSTGDEGVRIDLMLFEGTYAWFKSGRDNTGLVTCKNCKEVYKNVATHDCKKSCSKCRFPLKECIQTEIDYNRVCTMCHCEFRSEQCFENHQRKYEKSAPACDIFQNCNECGKPYDTRNGDHKCEIESCWIPPSEKDIRKLREKEAEFAVIIVHCDEMLPRPKTPDEIYLPANYISSLYYSVICHRCVQADTSSGVRCKYCSHCGQFRFLKRAGSAPYDHVLTAFLGEVLESRRYQKNCMVIGYNIDKIYLQYFIPVLMKNEAFPTVYSRNNNIIHMATKGNPADRYPANDVMFCDLKYFMDISELRRSFGTAGASFSEIEVLYRTVASLMKSTITLTSWNPLIHAFSNESFLRFLIKNNHVKHNMVGIMSDETPAPNANQLTVQDLQIGEQMEDFLNYYNDSETLKIYNSPKFYPSQLIKTPLPVGRPRKITENFEPITAGFELPYKGYYKIELVPPKTRIRPVVSTLIKGQLSYTLCKTCTEKKQQFPCEHSEEERRIQSVVYHTELLLALELGYIVCRIHEVWHWDRFQTDMYRDFLKGYTEKILPRKIISESEIIDWLYDETEKKEADCLENKEEMLISFAKMAIRTAGNIFTDNSVQSKVECYENGDIPSSILNNQNVHIIEAVSLTKTELMIAYREKKEENTSNSCYGAVISAEVRVELLRKSLVDCMDINMDCS